MPLSSSSLHLFMVWIEPQDLNIQSASQNIPTLAVKHLVFWGLLSGAMWRWQHGRAYSHLSSAVPFFSLHSITSRPHPLNVLNRFSPPRRWPSKTECPVLSVCHCQPAQEYQWPAAQSNQFLRGRSTVYLTSASLIIASKRKPINSSHHLTSPPQKPWHNT